MSSPWLLCQAARLPESAKALFVAWSFKAFALTGRQVCVHNYPGRCPGLGASALSGRVGQNMRKFSRRKEKELKFQVYKDRELRKNQDLKQES